MEALFRMEVEIAEIATDQSYKQMNSIKDARWDLLDLAYPPDLSQTPQNWYLRKRKVS